MTAEALGGAAREMVPLLAARARQAEAARRLPDETVAELRDAGLLRLLSPRRYGGHQLNLRTVVDVSAQLASGCASTAWIMALANGAAWLTSLFPEPAQEEILGENPDALIAAVPAPRRFTAVCRRIREGLLVSGKWGFCSGSLHADWLVLGAALTNERKEWTEDLLLLIPADQVKVQDTWFTAGMRATGSNTVLAHEVVVPEHRVMSLTRAFNDEYPTRSAEPLYRAAFAPMLVGVLAGPVLGLARSALDITLRDVQRRPVSSTAYERQSETQVAQVEIARAAVAIEAAELLIRRAVDLIDEAAISGQVMPLDQRTLARASIGYASHSCSAAIDSLVALNGASGMAEDKAVQRIWRDGKTIALHGMLHPTTALELYGRTLLGVPTDFTKLV